jgi:hypothetical protein
VLAEIARTLEEQARAGDTTDAETRIAAADEELGRVTAALADARARGWVA